MKVLAWIIKFFSIVIKVIQWIITNGIPFFRGIIEEIKAAKRKKNARR